MKMLSSTALLLLAPAALAAGSTSELQVFARRSGTHVDLTARVDGASGRHFWLLASAPGEHPLDFASGRVLGTGLLGADGAGELEIELHYLAQLHAGVQLQLTAAYELPGGSLGTTPSQVLAFGGGAPGCQLLDFDHAIGQIDPVPGEEISDQWSLAGIQISAINNVPGHPDLAIVFDTANPTGGDGDLVTPGYGPGNDEALGQVLIIAENAIDADMDGIVDVPDDEGGGGILRFDFEDPISMCSATLLDIDDVGSSELRFHKVGGGMTTIPVLNAGDNSRQDIFFDEHDVVAFEVVLGGSGALANLELEPCPLLVNLDETSLGLPLGFQAGLEITDQYQFLGVTISGTNNTPGHPDKVILFDSENPTGGDFDLQTPGPGVGNDTPLGFVLIIAENDVDADMDGHVDSPDDEERGGVMEFRFDSDVLFQSATVLDVDGSRNDFFAFYDSSDNLITTIPLQILGDNSVQSIHPDPPIGRVRRMELVLDGSGAITRVRWCPDPGPADAP